MKENVNEKFVIVLTDEYTVTRCNGSSFTVDFVSNNAVKKRHKGKLIETSEKWSGYYGTLYQALGAFVKHYYQRSNSLEEVIEKAEEAMGIINSTVEAMNSVDQALVEKYKVVKVSNN